MSHEQMDAQLERLTMDNHRAAQCRAERRKEQALNEVEREAQAERERLHRRQRAVYRTGFHIMSVVTAVGLIWGLSEMSTGNPVGGLMISLTAAGCGLVASIMDCLGR